MPHGPAIIYDKSTIQALNRAEIFCLERHFQINITPIFFAEVLADLHKPPNGGQTPEGVVSALAAKISGFNATPNVHHLKLCIGDLLGHAVETSGIPVVRGGDIVRSADGRTAMFYDEPPEVTAMRRWQNRDFLGVERDFAKAWRDELKVRNLEGFTETIRAPGKSPLRSLADVKAAADWLASGRSGKRYKTLKLALSALSIPAQFHTQIIARWKACNGPPLNVFAPYADYVFRVDLFFYLAIAANQIAATRPSHRIDIAYLYYLPFCKVFSSFDKLHAATVPLFLNDEQQVFIPGSELKADLAALAQYYDALPPEERAKGAMTYAAYPPRSGDFLTSRLFDRFEPEWRKFAESPIEITAETSARIMEHLGPMLDAIEAAKLRRKT